MESTSAMILLSLFVVGLTIFLLLWFKPWASNAKPSSQNPGMETIRVGTAVFNIKKTDPAGAGDTVLPNTFVTKIKATADIFGPGHIGGTSYKLCAFTGPGSSNNNLNLNTCVPDPRDPRMAARESAIIRNARLVKTKEAYEKLRTGYIMGNDYKLCGLSSQDVNYNPLNLNEFPLDQCDPVQKS